MTAPPLDTLATAVRFELVMRGLHPEPVIDQSAIDAVKTFLAQGAGETYMRRRFAHVLRLIGIPMRPSGWLNDVQIALGEYETYLVLQRKAAA